jgi:hypothetical protein
MGEVLRCYNGCSLRSPVFFCSFINGLAEFYPELYDSDGVSSQHEVNFGKKWSSYSTIISLANGDITKIDEVTLQPLEKCLLYLAYKADKNTFEALMHKEAMNKIRR